MNKNTKIGLIAVVIALAVVGFVSIGSDDETNTNVNSTDTNQSTASEQGSTDNPLGLDISSLAGAYSATFTTKEADGETSTGTITSDGKGNSQITTTDGGQSVGIIFVNGETYSQNPEDNSWIKFPASTADVPDTDSFGLSDADVDELNNNQNFESLGTQSCLSGTCRVYRDPVTDGDVTVIKVDASTNRLSEVEISSADGSTTTIVYSYDGNISIVAPANYTEFEIPSFDTPQ